jgi:hypothetical protein
MGSSLRINTAHRQEAGRLVRLLTGRFSILELFPRRHIYILHQVVNFGEPVVILVRER